MRYFTLELLDKSNSMDEAECEYADRAWMENLKLYWSNFKNYEHRLPKGFVKEYSSHGFHDYNIDSINYYRIEGRRKDTFNIELLISHDDKKCLIKYIDVTKCNIDLSVSNNFQTNVILYSEIIPVDDDKFSYEMIISSRNKMYIEFRKVMFKNICLK